MQVQMAPKAVPKAFDLKVQSSNVVTAGNHRTSAVNMSRAPNQLQLSNNAKHSNLLDNLESFMVDQQTQKGLLGTLQKTVEGTKCIVINQAKVIKDLKEEKAKLSQQLTSLEQKYDQVDLEQQSWSGQFRELQSVVQDAKKKLGESEKRASDIANWRVGVQDALTDMEAKCKKKSEEIEESERKFETIKKDLTDAIEEGKKDIKQLQDQAQMSKGEVSKLQEQLHAAKEEAKSVQKTLLESRAECKKVEDELKKAQTQKVAAMARKVEMEKDIDAKKAALLQKTEEVEKLVSKFDDEKKHHKEAIAAVESALKQVTKDKNSISKEKDTLLISLVEAKRTVEDQAQTIKLQLQDAKADRERMENRHIQDIHVVEKGDLDAARRLTAFEAQFTSLDECLRQLREKTETNMSEHAGKIKEFAKSLDQRTLQLSSKTADAQGFETTLLEREKKIECLEAEVQRQSKIINQHPSPEQLEEAKKKEADKRVREELTRAGQHWNETKRKEEDESKSQRSILEKEKKDLLDQLAAKEESVKEALRNLEALQKEKETEKSVLEGTSDELNKNKKELDKLKKTVNTREEKIAKLELSSKALKKDYTELQKQMDKSKEDASSLAMEKAKVVAEIAQAHNERDVAVGEKGTVQQERDEALKERDQAIKQLEDQANIFGKLEKELAAELAAARLEINREVLGPVFKFPSTPSPKTVSKATSRKTRKTSSNPSVSDPKSDMSSEPLQPSVKRAPAAVKKAQQSKVVSIMKDSEMVDCPPLSSVHSSLRQADKIEEVTVDSYDDNVGKVGKKRRHDNAASTVKGRRFGQTHGKQKKVAGSSSVFLAQARNVAVSQTCDSHVSQTSADSGEEIDLFC